MLGFYRFGIHLRTQALLFKDRVAGFWFDDGSGSINNPWNDADTWNDF